MPRLWTQEICCSNWYRSAPALNCKNIVMASSAETRVAASATARMITRKLLGTNTNKIAARNGQQMMRVRMDMVSRSFQSQIQDYGHTQREEERIGLQVACLQQAQGPAQELGGAMRAANN